MDDGNEDDDDDDNNKDDDSGNNIVNDDIDEDVGFSVVVNVVIVAVCSIISGVEVVGMMSLHWASTGDKLKEE